MAAAVGSSPWRSTPSPISRKAGKTEVVVLTIRTSQILLQTAGG
jgi:hypothetical protein